MKIKFNSDDNLPLKFHSMIIAVRAVFHENKYHLQVFLD